MIEGFPFFCFIVHGQFQFHVVVVKVSKPVSVVLKVQKSWTKKLPYPERIKLIWGKSLFVNIHHCSATSLSNLSVESLVLVAKVVFLTKNHCNPEEALQCSLIDQDTQLWVTQHIEKNDSSVREVWSFLLLFLAINVNYYYFFFRF